MITVNRLTKKYGDRTAVDDLSFEVSPGRVTGFLGPNGSGKSTTMRMLLGLDRPDSGSATIKGHEYAALPSPTRVVGALLDGRAVHPGRSARRHLEALAAASGVERSRVSKVLDEVGLTEVGHRRAGGYSLGMLQRLGIAGALLGEPEILILDEPVNGLDPEGVRWIRDLVQRLAREGRTILLSSHLMSEMQLTADHLIVIGQGRLITDSPLEHVLAESGRATHALVPDPEQRVLLSSVLMELGYDSIVDHDSGLSTSAPCRIVGDLAAEHHVRMHELREEEQSLEDAYRVLTKASLEYISPPAEGLTSNSEETRR